MTDTNARPQVDEVAADARSENHPDLWGGNPDCEQEIVDAAGGGIRCVKCAAWYCF